MNHFNYRDGVLHAEEVPLPRIAEAVGTPFYCYSTATLERHYRVLADAFAGREVLIAYSVKANSNLAVIATLARLGAGADVVSEGEVRRALAAGVAPDKVVFSGVGKTRAEMAFALEHRVVYFNVESEPELEALSEVAAGRGLTACVALRVNPDVAAGSHDKISTGRRCDKFGVDIDRAPALYRRAAALPGLEVDGVDVHIGSQLVELAPFRRAFERAIDLVRTLRADGHDIRRLDLGGGLGIAYVEEEPPQPEDYARMIFSLTTGLDCRIVLEPGRVIAGNAGVLVARVTYIKYTGEHCFVILDAAMNDLIRPALYGAAHRIDPVAAAAPEAPLSPVDLVGPVCETSDTFAVRRPMPPLAAGDLVAFRSAGAYGAVMASTYNSRLLVPEVLVKETRFAVVRRRTDYETVLGQDHIPDWVQRETAVSRGAA
jgi:diaminopimelate decarboxylase